MELTVVVHQEHESFWSEISQLPGCFASGGTLAELQEALGESIGLYLWDLPIELPDAPLVLGESIIRVSAPAGRSRRPADA
jgi:predicted RNase H-like HicB family nuclease